MAKKEFRFIKGSDEITGIKVTIKSNKVDFGIRDVFVKVYYDNETTASISESIKKTIERQMDKKIIYSIVPITKKDFKMVMIEVSSNEIEINLIAVNLEPKKFIISQ